MFEFDKYDSTRRRIAPAEPKLSYEPITNVTNLALLMWGEHCTECAAPSCYTTCDLFEARNDTRCRRFAYGMYKNENFKSLRGFGVEVEFKKWGSLEARGNTAMQPLDRVLTEERLIETSSPFVTQAGNLVNRVTGDPRWRYVTWAGLEQVGRRLHTLSKRTARCDAFLLELYNPMEQPVTLRFQINVYKPGAAKLGRKPEELPLPFVAKVTCPPGYSRHQFEARFFERVTASGLPFDIAITPEGDNTAHLVFLTCDFVIFDKAKATAGQKDGALPAIKCIVWDLDNTMWKGVLLENPDVALRDGIADTIKRLDGVGILHSISSKNDHENAWKRLTDLGLVEYFLYPRINWMPKSENIKQIAADLDIGIDTFAFVDDNPFELQEVGRALPKVTCIDIVNLETALADERFKGSTSADAKNRRRYYQDAIVRESKAASFGDDYRGFLASCDIKLDIKSFAPDDLERVAELVQRTNQLNFSGNKYKRDEIKPLLDDPTLEKLILSVTDNFGSYGVVGFGMVRRAEGSINVQDFMLSCRVQGKFIEQAFFNHLTQQPAGDYKRIWVNYKQTPRNTPARHVLDALSFAERRGEPRLSLELAPNALDCTFITVRRDDAR
jgi:FkbH-like protein